MNKKVIKCIVLITITCLLPILVLSGCVREKTPSSIQIVKDSFKDIYALDEGLNLQNAKIMVSFTDGSSETVSITASMIKGFDTSTTTTGRTLTVTYKGKSANFIYKVQNSIAIETSFRFNLSVVNNEEGGGYECLVKAHKASTVPEGVYAVRFTLSGESGVTLREPRLMLGDEFMMESYSPSVSTVVIVVYSVTGCDSLQDGDTIISLKVSQPSTSGAIVVQNASISNGVSDFVVPQTNVKVGE